MAGVFQACGGSPTALLASTTYFTQVGTSFEQGATSEAIGQVMWRDTGSLSGLYLNVSSNTVTSGSVFTSRIANTNGNQTVTVPNVGTGEYIDNAHVDAVTAGQTVDVQKVIGAGGTSLLLAIEGMIFNGTGSLNRMVATGTLTDTSVNTTYYQPLAGKINNVTTEANSQMTNRATATLQNLYCYISANTASVATVKSRLNGAPGNLSISISSGTTGALEDTAHSDATVSGDLDDYAFNSTVTTSITLRVIGVDYYDTSGAVMYEAANPVGSALTHGLTQWSAIAGNGTRISTESQFSCYTQTAFTASNLQTYVNSNGISGGSSPMTSRLNAANGNQVISIGAGTTGYLEDTTNSDLVGPLTEVDVQLAAFNGGTNIATTLIAFLASGVHEPMMDDTEPTTLPEPIVFPWDNFAFSADTDVTQPVPASAIANYEAPPDQPPLVYAWDPFAFSEEGPQLHWLYLDSFVLAPDQPITATWDAFAFSADDSGVGLTPPAVNVLDGGDALLATSTGQLAAEWNSFAFGVPGSPGGDDGGGLSQEILPYQRQLVKRDPDAQPRTRQHIDVVCEMLNNLSNAGYIRLIGVQQFNIVGGALTLTRDPGPNDDVSVGINPGNVWVNTTTQKWWLCVANTRHGALWRGPYS